MLNSVRNVKFIKMRKLPMFITAVYVWCLYVISACIIRSSSSLSFFQGLNEGVQEIIIRLLWSLEEYESLQYAPSNQGRQKKRKTETCSFMHHFSWSGDLVFPRLPWSLRVRAVIWLVRRTFGMNHNTMFFATEPWDARGPFILLACFCYQWRIFHLHFTECCIRHQTWNSFRCYGK